MTLHHIHDLGDLKKLSVKELEPLCQEIRQEIISSALNNGGHLASNLGVVELTVALHYVFDSPNDKIIWDVGHQCYTHKLLTGRDISKIRQHDGVSGFPRPSESEHDAFACGHSSTSLSAAHGMATARDILGENYHVISVIGDAALSGGMAFEALNNIGADARKQLIILNDNKMSISKSVGAMAKHLSKLRLNKAYTGVKYFFHKTTSAIPLVGKGINKAAGGVRRLFKFAFVHNKLFEQLGLKYLGPFDGHNLPMLIDILKRVSTENKPVLLHLITKKGKGYENAENSPDKYHGISNTQEDKELCFSSVCGQALKSLAQSNPAVVAVTAAMPDGTGLTEFAQEYPDRFFDVGIAEEHAVTFCAGLAKGGLKPYFAVYSTFLQRGFDQIIHDVALQKLPVTFLIDRAGVVGNDGATHQGVFDLSYLRMIPHLTIAAPKDTFELAQMIKWSEHFNMPLAIRYPKNCSSTTHECAQIVYGKWEILSKKSHNVLLCVGDRMLKLGYELKKLLGDDAQIVNARFIKPLDEEFLLSLSKKHKLITLEDNTICGGFQSAVLEFFANRVNSPTVFGFGLPDKFIEQGNSLELLQENGLDAQAIYKVLKKLL